MDFFSNTKKGFSERKEMEGSDGTCEGTDDTTTLVQIEEAKCVIREAAVRDCFGTRTCSG